MKKSELAKALRERIIWHLDVPICKIMSGLRIHLQVIGLFEQWKLGYALKCDTPEKLHTVMWDMIKKRQRKDSKWQKCLPGPKDLSSNYTKAGRTSTKSRRKSKRTSQKSQKPVSAV